MTADVAAAPITPEARRAGRLWGAAIVGGLAVVVIVNMVVVWLVRGDSFPLVSDAYYQEALQYDGVQRAGDAARAAGMQIAFDGAGALLLTLPADVAQSSVTVGYYRPNDPALDFSTRAHLQPDGRWLPEQLPGAPGRWDVTVHARSETQTYSLSQQWYYSPSNP